MPQLTLKTVERVVVRVTQDVLRDILDDPREEIPLTAKFRDDLGGDSLSLVNIILFLEEELDVSIPDEALPSSSLEALTVQQIIDVVTQLKKDQL